MTDLSTLIAKLSEAKEGSRELNAEIEVALDIRPDDLPDWAKKWKGPLGIISEDTTHLQWNVALLHDDGTRGLNWEPEHYTTSLDAALTLVPRGPKGHMMAAALEVYSDGQGNAWVLLFNGDKVWSRTQASPALALCIACLKAQQSDG